MDHPRPGRNSVPAACFGRNPYRHTEGFSSHWQTKGTLYPTDTSSGRRTTSAALTPVRGGARKSKLRRRRPGTDSRLARFPGIALAYRSDRPALSGGTASSCLAPALPERRRSRVQVACRVALSRFGPGRARLSSIFHLPGAVEGVEEQRTA